MNVRTFAVFLCLILIVPPGLFLLFDRRPAVRTVMAVEPSTVQPGSDVQVLWWVDVLRPHCRGRVHPQVEISGLPTEHLPTQDAAVHDEVGHYGPLRVRLSIPADAPRGARGIVRRLTDRWCNPLQMLLWPMHEVHEAGFMVAPTP